MHMSTVLIECEIREHACVYGIMCYAQYADHYVCVIVKMFDAMIGSEDRTYAFRNCGYK